MIAPVQPPIEPPEKVSWIDNFLGAKESTVTFTHGVAALCGPILAGAILGLATQSGFVFLGVVAASWVVFWPLPYFDRARKERQDEEAAEAFSKAAAAALDHSRMMDFQSLHAPYGPGAIEIAKANSLNQENLKILESKIDLSFQEYKSKQDFKKLKRDMKHEVEMFKLRVPPIQQQIADRQLIETLRITLLETANKLSNPTEQAAMKDHIWEILK